MSLAPWDIAICMHDIEFFTWRRTMLSRFQEMASAEDVFQELQFQTQKLEFDYYSLCVRHPVPFTRPKVAYYSTYPEAWVSYYQQHNFLAIDPVLKPENFSQGHLLWDDALFSEAQPLWDAARAHGLRRGVTQYLMLSNRALGFLSLSRMSARCARASGLFYHRRTGCTGYGPWPCHCSCRCCNHWCVWWCTA